MKITIKNNDLAEISVETPGNVLHRIDSDTYAGSSTTIKADDSALWEECPKPPFTKAQYDAKVAELIREKYSANEEAALKSKMLAAILHPDAAIIGEDGQPKAVSQFDAFLAYREECLHRAKDPALYAVDELPE